MSEAERKKRFRYKRKRSERIFLQSVVLAIVAFLIFVSVIIYDQLNEEYYINYTESSNVDYRVKVPKDAEFYRDHLDDYKEYADSNGDLWLPPNYAYAAKAVSVIRVTINYKLDMEARGVDYEYTYRIFATAEIVDAKTKDKFKMPVYELERSENPIIVSSDNELYIMKMVEINYQKYNSLVEEFEEKLDIKNANETLIVTMEVDVKGSSESFADDNENKHTISMNIPLTENSFSVNYSTSVSPGDNRVLAKKNAGNQDIVKNIITFLSVVEAVLLVVLLVFITLTRNHDVNYTIKVRRLIRNYRSFIQKVENGFDITDYQIVKIASFQEMLAIRDTIQSPVLMSENKDQTKTQFFIPTNTKILYLYELKVDNYDELYGSHPEWEDNALIPEKVEKIEAKTVEVPALPVAEEAAPREPVVTKKPSGYYVVIVRKHKSSGKAKVVKDIVIE